MRELSQQERVSFDYMVSMSSRSPSGCLVWGGAKGTGGYGVVAGKPAHRVMWMILHGPIRPKMWILHHCDNPPCIEPSHLYIGTPKDNNWDTSRRRRRPTTVKCGWCGEVGHSSEKHRR